MNATLVTNRRAGSLNGPGAPTPAELRDAFAGSGMAIALEEAGPGELASVLARVVARRPRAVLVAGGDGTVSTAARHLAGTDLALGVVPLGTLNHFARDLGLPADWREAVAVLCAGHSRRVDVAEVNGHLFVNNCSIGSYPEAVRHRERLRRQRGHGKWTAMLLASVAVFRRLRRLRLRISISDTSTLLRTPFVIVGNNRYSGHLLGETLRPRLDAGQLWLYTTRAKRRLTLLRLAWQSLTRRIDAADRLEAQAVTAATIASVDGRPLPVAADGELIDVQAPLHFRTRPGALRVLAPPPEP